MATTPVFEMKPPWTPELLPVVQKEIEDYLDTIRLPFVLEVGSGWSTLWLAQIADVLHSIEHDPAWYAEVTRCLTNLENACYACDTVLIASVELTDKPGGIVRQIFSEGQETCDLILIDCVDEERLPAICASVSRLKRNGWLVVDDSHWEMFDGLQRIMFNMGFAEKIYSGQHTRKTGEVKYHQTTIFSRRFK